MTSWVSSVLLLLGSLTLLRWLLVLLQEVQRAVKVHLLPRFTSKRFRKYGEWAVVTGASDGIGKGYVRELAAAGMNIILIARNKDKLDKVAQEISSKFGVETMVIVADYGHGRGIYTHIEHQLQGKDIGILVNNVGSFATGIPCNFSHDDVNTDVIWEMVNINVASVPAMTKIVLPGMLTKGRGAIVNIASMASMMPLPMMTLYCASKAFVDFFTQALNEECRGTGVVVQGVHPGAVKTKMSKNLSEAIPDKYPAWSTPDTLTYCSAAVASLGHTDYTTGYWAHGILAAVSRAIPRWMILGNMKVTMAKARKMALKKT